MAMLGGYFKKAEILLSAQPSSAVIYFDVCILVKNKLHHSAFAPFRQIYELDSYNLNPILCVYPANLWLRSAFLVPRDPVYLSDPST